MCYSNTDYHVNPLSKRFDLNLIQVLEVLLEEENVTAAAKRLHLTQSAVSKHLARLRIMFGDPLFDRTSNGLKPTPRALELAPRIRQLSLNLAGIVQSNAFDFATSERRFRIDALETTYSLVIPKFIPDLLQQAPSVGIETRIWDQGSLARLQRCEVDLGLAYREWDDRSSLHMELIPKEVHRVELMQDETVCLLRADHPALNKQWNLKLLLQYRHIQVAFEGMHRWLLDDVLAAKGLRRNIAIEMPDFYSAMTLCEKTDLLLCAPKRHALTLLSHFGLKMLALPLVITPGAYVLLWHDHFENDRGHRWLREHIIERVKSPNAVPKFS